MAPSARLGPRTVALYAPRSSRAPPLMSLFGPAHGPDGGREPPGALRTDWPMDGEGHETKRLAPQGRPLRPTGIGNFTYTLANAHANAGPEVRGKAGVNLVSPSRMFAACSAQTVENSIQWRCIFLISLSFSLCFITSFMNQ